MYTPVPWSVWGWKPPVLARTGVVETRPSAFDSLGAEKVHKDGYKSTDESIILQEHLKSPDSRVQTPPWEGPMILRVVVLLLVAVEGLLKQVQAHFSRHDQQTGASDCRSGQGS